MANYVLEVFELLENNLESVNIIKKYINTLIFTGSLKDTKFEIILEKSQKVVRRGIETYFDDYYKFSQILKRDNENIYLTLNEEEFFKRLENQKFWDKGYDIAEKQAKQRQIELRQI